MQQVLCQCISENRLLPFQPKSRFYKHEETALLFQSKSAYSEFQKRVSSTNIPKY